jgi:hypothetical protein
MRASAFGTAVLAALAIAASACAYEPEETLRARAANDFKCDEDNVKVFSIAGSTYQAKGCGKSGVYDCTRSSIYETFACIPEREQKGE